MKAYASFWKNYANFHGKSSLKEYWIPFLVHFLINIILGILTQSVITQILAGNPVTFGVATVAGIISFFFGLAIFIPGLAVLVRRLRDAGKSWTNIFWVLLPLAGIIVLLVLLLQPSKTEA